MHHPTESSPELDEILDPTAVERAYRQHRARRSFRIEHKRETQRARLRFWAVLAGLLLGSLVLVVTIWQQIKHLFGL